MIYLSIINKKNSSKGYLVIKENKVLEVKGPPINLDEKIKQFKKLHKNTFEKKGYCLLSKRN
jgi:hypothetical protein